MAAQRFPLPEVERLSGSVIRLLAGNPGKRVRAQSNNGSETTIWHCITSDCNYANQISLFLLQYTLQDTGEGRPSWSAVLRELLAAEKATVKHALLTHWHRDHVGGVADLLKMCPEAQVYKHDGREGQLTIEDGQIFQVQGATLRAIHTPGHTTDHVSFLLEDENALFTGDNVLGHGTAVFENLVLYLSTLEKMRNLGAGRGYPGHGAVIEDCEAKITEYIDHRRQREEEVFRVLNFGGLGNGNVRAATAAQGKPRALSPADLVAVIYPDLAEELRLSASHGVLQVLLKLEGEGKVIRDGESEKWMVRGGKAAL
ncbi:metallo-beta-lactamase superfamily protein [Histoplasma capsulatum G186AR]|uniref:Lactamase-like protein nscB n=1 Tax=Ajellomyces capsulatus (strain G186AR / H82 / ATCC MYA-2454 / RMSCC 2432) TaxID=447093 RepID=C0NH59_AJECG|nr:metallo-beta-lactamase superfamily protein [Histoplasma capsulatum G186AR]EEH09144.1 metallo-beta-lactamase superfamily protein [Histoplasma capsulatum G186AR]